MLPWLISYQHQLSSLLAAQKLAHGILLSGPQGVGKATLANWLSAWLLCTAEPVKQRPCQQCKSCLLRLAGSHSDYFIVEASGSSIGVDVVRQITVFMQGRAQQQRNKVVVLPKAETLTEAASNALLKTLEEPPQNSYLILQSTGVTQLSATLNSRLQHWPIAAQLDQHSQHWLEQHSNRPVPDFLLAFCGGGPLKALQLLESGGADTIQLQLNLLQQFFAGTASLQQLLKQLEASDHSAAVIGWYLRSQLLVQLLQTHPERVHTVQQQFARWCRDEQTILGQNKQLALSALLTGIFRLYK